MALTVAGGPAGAAIALAVCWPVMRRGHRARRRWRSCWRGHGARRRWQSCCAAMALAFAGAPGGGAAVVASGANAGEGAGWVGRCRRGGRGRGGGRAEGGHRVGDLARRRWGGVRGGGGELGEVEDVGGPGRRERRRTPARRRRDGAASPRSRPSRRRSPPPSRSQGAWSSPSSPAARARAGTGGAHRGCASTRSVFRGAGAARERRGPLAGGHHLEESPVERGGSQGAAPAPPGRARPAPGARREAGERASTSLTDENRSAATGAEQRRAIAVSSFSPRGGALGPSLSACPRVSRVAGGEGRAPVASSHKSAPRAQMSDEGWGGSPCKHSGRGRAGTPRARDSSVTALLKGAQQADPRDL